MNAIGHHLLIACLSLGVLAPSVLVTSTAPVEAAEKKKKTAKKLKRSDFTKEQQKKIFEQGLAICRKKYGSRFERVEVSYIRNSYICYVR